jgi:signal transduction histidine kinase
MKAIILLALLLPFALAAETTDFEERGLLIAEDFTALYDKVITDTLNLSKLDFSNISMANDALIEFSKANHREIWYNLGSDIAPIEQRKAIPFYNRISVTDKYGMQIIRIIENKPVPFLKDISKTENTFFLSEDYFHKAKSLPEGKVNVGKVMTWYTTTDEVFKDVPDDQERSYEKVIARDAMKTGIIRFSTPLYRNGQFIGVLTLSLDYRHLAELTKHIDPASDKPVVSTSYAGNYILVFDSDGNTIIHPKPDNIRGYLENGSLAGFNEPNSTRPGQIFNLFRYAKSPAYREMAESVLRGQTYTSSATDVSGRTKLTIAVPISYSNPSADVNGVIGGIMMSVAEAKKEESLEELAIKLNAKTVAEEVDNYLKNNPEKTVKDLQNDEEFRKIAVQIVGRTGYTLIADANSGYFYFHPQEHLVDTDSHLLKDQLPEWWKIIERSIGPKCIESSGYYNWIEQDGSLQQKYMYLACIGKETADGKNLMVAATSYIDEVSARNYLEKYGISLANARQFDSQTIKDSSRLIAKQIEIYLQSNPKLTSQELKDDEYFREIAVQRIAGGGYTVLYDYDTMINFMHYNKEYDGIDYNSLKEKSPGFWEIAKHTIGGNESEADGFYDWLEPNGTLREKYMYNQIIPVNTADGKRLALATTIYTDDFIFPSKEAVDLETYTPTEFRTGSFEILANSFDFWANDIDSRFDILPKIPSPELYVLDLIKKSRRNDIDDFEKEFALIDGAWRTNVEYFKETAETEDIAGVIIYSNYELTPENKLAMLELQQDTKLYADAVKAFFDNYYFMFEAGYYSMYPKEWIFADEHNSSFKEDLWYYIADPEHNPQRNSVWTPAYYDSVLEQWMTSLITPIYENDKFLGIAGGDIPLEDIFNEISDTNYNGEGYALIFDTDKNIVIHPFYLDEITRKGEMEEVFTFKDIKEKELSRQIEGISNDKGTIRYTENGKEQILLYQKLDSIGWYYAFVIDASLVSAPSDDSGMELKNYLLPLTIAFIAVIFILLILVQARLIKLENNTVLFLLAATLLIIIGLFVFNTYQTTQSIKNNKISSTVSELTALADTQEHHLEHILKDSRIFVETVATQQELSIDELKEIKILNNDIQKTFVLDSSGKIIVSTDESQIGLDKSADSYFARGREHTYMHIINASANAREYSLVISTPFHDGVLVSIFGLEELDGLTQVLQDISETGESLIAYRNEQNNAIFITKQRFDGPREIPNNQKEIPITQALLGHEQVFTDARDYRNAEVIAVTRYIDELDAGHVVKIDKQEAIGLVSKTTNAIWFFTLGILVSIMGIGTIFYFLLTKSLRNNIEMKTEELQISIKELENTKTAIMNMMEDLSSANSDLKKLDEAKSNFLNMVSHELKTPLTAMLAHIEVMDDGKKNLSAQQLSSIDAVKRNCNQLRMLIENILEIARIESNKFQLIITKVDVNRVIMDAVSNLRILADNKGIHMEQNIEKLPFINTDEIRLKEIMNNLISNAIKLTEKGGIIVRAKKEKGHLKVTVADTGIGIPEAKMKELFTKFYQVDASLSRRYGGTGLGLSITKQLVELMGGAITVESKEGKGSSFTFTLPLGRYK